MASISTDFSENLTEKMLFRAQFNFNHVSLEVSFYATKLQL